MAEIFQKIKQENTTKIFIENYIVKHNAITNTQYHSLLY